MWVGCYICTNTQFLNKNEIPGMRTHANTVAKMKSYLSCSTYIIEEKLKIKGYKHIFEISNFEYFATHGISVPKLYINFKISIIISFIYEKSFELLFCIFVAKQRTFVCERMGLDDDDYSKMGQHL